MAKLVWLGIIGAAAAAAQIVEGTVYDAVTGAGAAGVKVELLKQTTPFYETSTDGGGHFRFDHIREADYAVRYQSPDYFLTAGPSDYKPFRAAEGSTVTLEARLIPWSKISGRVVDGRGKPVPDAVIQINGSGMLVNGRTYLRSSWGGGGGGQLSESRLGMAHTGKADAHGKFEVQLMPGSYQLRVTPPLTLDPPDREEGGPALAWARTFYPGVTDRAAAADILVLPGAEVADIELKLLAVPTRSVRGVVLNPDGTPAAKAAVALGMGFQPRTVETKPDGSFAFDAVPENEWQLLARSAKLRSVAWVEVSRHDVENVKLRLLAPVTIRGKAIVEGSKRPLPRTTPIVLSRHGERGSPDEDFVTEDFAPAISVPAVPDSNGEFVMEVQPGTYHLGVMLQPAPPPYYLDAVRIGGGDLTMQEVEISSDAAMTVVYRTDGGSVAGTAENCASGGVVLIATDPVRRGHGFSKSGACDASGHYEVSAVRPGDYLALALAGNSVLPEFDDALLNQGTRVTVRANEATSADVKAITKPVY